MAQNNHIVAPLGGIEYLSKGYFMSQEQEDAVAGRTIRELGVVKRECVSLVAEAHNLGSALVQLGTRLGGDPDTIAATMVDGKVVDAARITQLTETLRAALVQYHRLGAEAETLGIHNT
jgi:hypothetical protein